MATLAVEETQGASIDVEDTVESPNEIRGVGATSAMTAIAQGNDVGFAYRSAVRSGDLNGAMLEWQSLTTNQRAAVIEGKVDTSSTEATVGELRQLGQNMSGVNGEEGIATESSRLLTEDEEEVSDQALDTMVRNALTRYSDEETNWEATKSFVGVFFPERKSFLLNDVLNDFGWTNSALDTIGIDTDEIRRFRNVYDGASNKNKARIIQSFNKSVDAHGDNPFINTELAGNLFAPTFQGEAFSTLFNVLDATVVFDLAYLAKVGTVALVESSNILVGMSKLKKADVMAGAVKGAVENPEAAAKVGVKPSDVVNAQDIIMSESVRELVTGSKSSMAGEVKHMFDLQDEIINQVLRTTLREGVLDTNEQAQVIAQVKTRLAKQDNIKSNTVKVDRVDESTYKVSYTKVNYNAKGEAIGTEKVVKDQFFLTKSVQPILKADEQFVEKFLALDSNARTRGQLRNYFVSVIERIAPTQSRLQDAIKRAVNVAYKGLSAKNEAAVNEALLMGAKFKNKKGEVVGRVYTFEELTGAGIGVNRLTLSPKEAKAYFGHRNVLDNLLELENTRFVENLGARGISIVDLPNQTVPAKVFETSDGAFGSFLEAGELARITDAGTRGSPHISVQGQGLRRWSGKGGLIKLNSFFDVRKAEWKAMFKDAYSKGYVLAKNDNAQQLFRHGEARTQWAFVKQDKVINPRGQPLLNRKRGYIPKQRTNAHFFIKTTKSGVLSGSKGFQVDSTAAWSDNMADAVDWVKRTDGDYVIVKDGEMTPTQRLYESNSTQGGLYRGARKSTEIEFVGKDGTGEFANSMEALQGYVNHIGRQFPINLIRLGLEKRAILTAKEIGIPNAKHLGDLISKSHVSGVKPRTRKILKEMHDQVAFLRNIPTEAEIEMSDLIMKIGTQLEGSLITKIPGFKKIPNLFYNVAGKGTQPQDYIRGITFNTLLGMYNPAQIMVQASGMFASFAINPVHFAKAVPKGFGYATLDQISNPFQLKQSLKWMRENGLEEFADGYEMWARTGLRENVINSNADYVSVFMRETPYDAGVLRKVLSNHTIFYKMGELVNTRMAFATAYEWYKKTNNITRIDPTDDVALRAIFKRSEINRLNMSRANQSDLNKGFKAVPFQFQQVISKYYEKVLPQVMGGTDELTKLEKYRLFGIVSGITGAVGVPLAETVYLTLLDLANINPEELSPEVATAFKYGALGTMLNVGDVNIDISTRTSLGVDAWRLVAENLREGHNILEFVGGPTHGVTKRAVKQIQFLSTAFDTYTDIEESTPVSEDLQVGFSMVFEALTDFVTVSRNIKSYSAYLLGDNPAFYRDGQYILDFETMNQRTAAFGIFGFQPQELTELYEVSNTIKREQGSATGGRPFFELEAKVMLRLINTNILGARNDREAKIGSMMVNSMLRNRPTKEGLELFDRMNELAYKKKLDQDNLYFKYIQEISDGIDYGFGVVNTEMSRQHENRTK